MKSAALIAWVAYSLTVYTAHADSDSAQDLITLFANSSGERFEDVEVTLENCVLTRVRRDADICSTKPKSGIYEITEVLNLSKLDADRVKTSETRAEDLPPYQVQMYILPEFSDPVRRVREEYSRYVQSLKDDTGKFTEPRRLEPFFSTHHVADLPIYRTTKSCTDDEGIAFRTDSSWTFIEADSPEKVQNTFQSNIAACGEDK